MTFELVNFTPAGGQGARGNSPQAFDYKHADDTTSAVETSGYFNGARTYLEVDDLITVVNPQVVYQYRVISVPLVGDVTIERIPVVEVGHYYMIDNSTVTTISQTSTAVKAAGTTSGNALSNKFDVTTTTNRALYTGSIQGLYKITAMAQLKTDSDEDQETICMLAAKNGTAISDSQGSGMTSEDDDGPSTVKITIQTLTNLTTNDYIEIFVRNESSTENITVEYLSVVVERIH